MSSFCLKNRLTTSTGNGTQIRRLVAFDFDHTVVNDNTDVVVRDLLDKKYITPEVQQFHKDGLWTVYMQEIFHILFAKGFTKTQIKSTIEAMPEVSGLKELIRQLHASSAMDVIIISDSNSTFIKYWCDFNDITECIKTIFTNPAEFNEDGLLRIQPFHQQEHCALSSVNLCKGDVLEDFVKQQFEKHNIIYERIFYVGDGSNDLCPILRLGPMDFGLAREGFALQNRLAKLSAKSEREIVANTKSWANGAELKTIIFN